MEAKKSIALEKENQHLKNKVNKLESAYFRLLKHYQNVQQDRHLINRITKGIFPVSNEIQRSLKEMGNRICSSLSISWCAFILLDTEKKAILQSVFSGSGTPSELSFNNYQKLMKGPIGKAIKTGLPVYSAQTLKSTNETSYMQKQVKDGDRMAVIPLYYTNTLLGTLTVTRNADMPDYTEREKEIITTLAEQASVSIYTSSILEQSEAELNKQKQEAESLQNQLETKDSMIKEIQHRIKNNLLMISSFVNVESPRANKNNFRQILHKLSSRIDSVASVHKRLSISEHNNAIEAGEYVTEIAKNLRNSYTDKGKYIRLNVETDTIFLSVKTALYVGLIVNELIQNAYYHAFEYNEKGKISVSLKKMENSLVLRVTDSGKGFNTTEEKDMENKDTIDSQAGNQHDTKNDHHSHLGLKLIKSFSDSIEGVITHVFKPEHGFEIEFYADDTESAN